MIQVSVILCTFNPSKSITRVFKSLRAQTLSKSLWEFILVDNNSTSKEFINKIPILGSKTRVLKEKKQGLLWARIAGIKTATGKIICFVDDDNVLDKNYLKEGLKIASKMPYLGCWGGQIIPEYENEPQKKLVPYLPLLANFQFDKDLYANFPSSICLPRGAGLFVRKQIAITFKVQCQHDPLRKLLGRSGAKLISGEDTDLAYTSFKNGMSIGVFKKLKLLHIIPEKRLSKKYLLELEEAMSYSWTILNYLYSTQKTLSKRPLFGKIVDFIRWFFSDFTKKQFSIRSIVGKKRALKIIMAYEKDKRVK